MHPIGKRFGALKVVGHAGTNSENRRLYLVRCFCGKTKTVRGNNLLRSKSCGCLNGVVHGHTRNGRPTSEYISWCSMLSRCYGKGSDGFARYGAKGVRVCKEWRDSFLSFYRYVGKRPGPRYSLDRIDNSGSYEPGNVRWASPKQQQRNKSTNRIIEYGGCRMCVAEAAEKFGINYRTLMSRLYLLGWTDEEAIEGRRR